MSWSLLDANGDAAGATTQVKIYGQYARAPGQPPRPRSASRSPHAVPSDATKAGDYGADHKRELVEDIPTDIAHEEQH